MKKISLLKIFIPLFFFAMPSLSKAQDQFSAILSQDGSLSFRITQSDFYFYISPKGKITGSGSNITGTISYNVYGKVEKIGSLNISYNVYGNVDRVGNSNISYDVYSRISNFGSIQISYNVYDKIERIAGKNVSYNVYEKVERVGSANISYNVYGNVERITDSEGFMIFRTKLESGD